MSRDARSIVLSWPGKERLGLDGPPVSAGDLEIVERVGSASAPENLLVFGDNLVAMRVLEERFAGAIDLVYIDPPYATGLSYYSQTDIGSAPIERRAYRDHHTGGMVGYLEQMYLRLGQVRRLLSEDGKLFLHCDWRANSLLRVLLDEIFGPACFRNEIIWRRAPNLGRQAASKQLGRVIDSILVYSKTPGAPFPGPVPRRRTEVPLDSKGKPKGARWDPDAQAYFTTAPRGDYTDDSIAKLSKQGRVHRSPSGTVYIKYFLTRGEDGRWYKEQPVDTLWDDYEVRPLRHRPKAEDMGYDTQKPEGLLERIVGWASKPGDLVADFFCGSGTALAVAQAMGRRFIGCDAGQAAIDITRRRLAVSPDASFEVASVVRAERRAWAADLEDGDAPAVLRAFGATPTGGRFGERDGALVWVGPLSRAARESDITDACRVAAQSGKARVEVLAWEYSAHDTAALRARVREHHGVELSLRIVPIELARGRKQLRFGELAEVELELVPGDDARRLGVRLTGLRCPDPPPLRGAAKAKPSSWVDLIDSWAVDFDYSGNGFVPGWRSERDKASRRIELQTPTRVFGGPAQTVLVKVVTVYGDEIVRSLRIET